MDYLSPSSTATATTTSPPDSDKTLSTDGPKYTYTTAGTIYDPNSVQPLQAPTRRGRALKFPFGTNTSTQPTLFPKSALTALGLENFSRTRTSPRPQYTPLQQNLDRAVSPNSRQNSKQVNTPLTPESPSEMHVEMPRMRSGNMPASQESPVLTAVSVNKQTEANDTVSDSSDDDLDLDQEPLRNFPVKSLHNLASYPNPNQKRAQKVLRSARLTANSATSNETGTRSNTPFPGTNGFESVQITKDEQPQPAMALQTPYKDLTSMLEAHPESKKEEVTFNWRAPNGRFGEVENKKSGAEMYKSPLASGPGAPKPLTAGPPGQRQYKPSTLESTLRNLKNSGPREPSKYSIPDDDEATIEFRALLESRPEIRADTTRPLSAKHMQPLGPIEAAFPLHQPTPIGTALSKTSLLVLPIHEEKKQISGQSVLHDALHPTRGMLGLKEPGYSRKRNVQRGRIFYEPFADDQTFRNNNAKYERKKWAVGTYQRTTREIEAHNKLVAEQFFGKSSETNINKHCTTSVEREFHDGEKIVGVIGDRRARSGDRSGEEDQKMVIQDVNKAPTNQSMEPLLAMALSSLTRNLDAMQRGIYDRQYVKPDARLVDTSAEGLQTFFGKSTEIKG